MSESRALVLLILLLGAAAQASEPVLIPTQRGPDRVDVSSTRKIRAYATDPSYSTPWVDYLPASDTVPSPPEFLGYVTGAPDSLSRPERIAEYFRALAAATDRVRIFSMGRSHGGREMIVAAVAEAGLLARLEQIKAANRELADPRRTDEARALEIASTTPPSYWITAGLHSPETGPPEMVMELAYRLAVSEQQLIREIRNGVVTLITPVLETDGRARMVDWYYRHLTGVTDWEEMPPRMAPYWGDYTAHDNNRDGLQQSQPLTRNYTDTYFEFLPVVSLDLHESVPLLYISMGTGPYNELVDPITVSEWHWMAGWDVSQATKLGLQGVWTWGFYTGWYPGYLLWVTNNHNATGRFYETFGNAHPGTFERKLKHSKFAQHRVNTRQWYRPWPPDKKVVWSLRNNINYMQTGVLASLQLAARNGDTLLYNFWRKGRNSLERGRKHKPHAFRIPAEQRDRGALHQLLWLLQRQRIEVHQAQKQATLGNVEVHEGDYLVRMDQPYRNLARSLLMKQSFPKTAQFPPYDDVAWSLDSMLGVTLEPVDDPAVLELKASLLEAVPELPGSVERGRRWLVEHRAQARLAGLPWALPDARIAALAREWQGHPAGSLVIEDADRRTLERVCGELRLDAMALDDEPEADLVPVDRPRLALFHTWRYTQDSGWARFSLEQLGIPYTLINKDDLRAGGLGGRFDVILVPNQGRLDFEGMVHGIDPKWGPMPYTKTEEFPSHGIIDSADDITGGMGFEGLAHLQEFVREGGTLITLGSGGLLASDGGLAREVSSSRPKERTPGSHLTTRLLRPEHPVSWGYPETTWVFRGNLPLYDVREHVRGMTVMQFGTTTLAEAEREADHKADIPVDDEMDPEDEKGKTEPAKPKLLLSGRLTQPDEIDRKPAILDVPVGRGRVLLYAFNPLHRYQNHHDFAFLTNALLFASSLPEAWPSAEEMTERESR